MTPQNRPDFNVTGLSEGGLLNVAAVAAELGVTGPHVRTLINSGDLRATNIARDGAKRPRWRIKREEVRRFVDRRTSEPPAPRPPRRRPPFPNVKTFFE